ncbi:MAG: hypothetical protein J6D26_09430 [Clostridia bacterium]|nr:hypothetical protein [Clostridia bacterium]
MIKKITLTLALLLCISSATMADETTAPIETEQNTEQVAAEIYSVKDKDKDKNKDKNKDKEARKKDVADKLEKKLAKKTKLKKAKEFKSIMDCNDKAAYNNVSEYVSFTCKNDFTDDRLDVINRILESGTTIQSLKQVYEFWLTTDEDFFVVEQICALEDSYFSEYWYERAFNKLTNYEHGALSGEELREYQEAGITTDEILAANVMCRKQGQNIYDILDSVIAGTGIEQQAMALYGVDTIPEEGSLFSDITEIAKSGKASVEAITLMAEETEETIEQDEIFFEVIEDKINEELASMEISVPENDYHSDYESLKKSKYPISVQRALMNKGFTPQEIEKSAEIPDWNFYNSAKKAREMLKNEK